MVKSDSNWFTFTNVFTATDLRLQTCSQQLIYVYKRVHNNWFTFTNVFTLTDLRLQTCSQQLIYVYKRVHSNWFTFTNVFTATDLRLQMCSCAKDRILFIMRLAKTNPNLILDNVMW